MINLAVLGCLENLHCQFSYKCAVAVRNSCQTSLQPKPTLYSKRISQFFETDKGYKV